MSVPSIRLCGIVLLAWCAAAGWGEDDGLARNNVIHLEGRGNGSATRSGSGSERLSNVNVDIDRGGKILVSFRTGRKQALTFSGAVIESRHDLLKADVASDDPARLRGSMYLWRDERGEITRVSLQATNGQDQLRVDWNRR